MGFTSQSLVLLLNLINLVYLTETLNSTARSDSNKGKPMWQNFKYIFRTLMLSLMIRYY
jgi:hypothetical protein